MKKNLELIDILKELYTISGFRMSVYDTSLKEICAYPEEKIEFCTLIQSNKKGLTLCRRYDNGAFEKVRSDGEVYLYRCHFGLYEAVAPLYNFGVLSGYLMMGQTIDTMKINRSYVTDQASQLVSDQELLQKAVKSIPSRSREQILSCITIMGICADYLTLTNHMKNTDKDLPSKIHAYLTQNYAEKITLDCLCDACFCSRAALTRSFRSSYGLSINQYLTKIRLDKSLKLLENPHLSIAEIALACGFGTQNYFTKVFKKHFGKIPSEIRKSLDSHIHAP